MKEKKTGNIIIDLSANDFELLEKMVKEGGHFKSVEDYIIFMIQNRLTKFRGE